MSCIVIDTELADEDVTKKLETFIEGKVQGYAFRAPESRNPQNKFFGVNEICTEMCKTMQIWINVTS